MYNSVGAYAASAEDCSNFCPKGENHVGFTYATSGAVDRQWNFHRHVDITCWCHYDLHTANLLVSPLPTDQKQYYHAWTNGGTGPITSIDKTYPGFGCYRYKGYRARIV